MLKSSQQKLITAARSAWSFLAAQNYLVILVIVLAVIAIRLPIDYKRIMTPTDQDYTTHIAYALDMLHHRPVPAYLLAHSLWQLFLIFMWWLSRSHIGFWHSAILLQVLSSIASALIVYFWYGALATRPSPWKRAFWAVTLVIVSPVVLPFLLDGAYYFGYIGLASYHNPTVHVLRPFALLMFIFAIEALERPRHSAWVVLASALVMALATFLKPNYTITLLPALGLMALYWLFRRKPLDWWLLIFGLGLPAVLVLAAQYVITYIGGEPGSGIAILPFVTIEAKAGYLGIKFFLSIFFPLVATALFARSARLDHEMVLAWLGFAWGAAQFYLLVEKGSRATHGNFWWSGEISLFILFAVLIRYLLKQDTTLSGLVKRKTWIAYAAYLPHVAGGIAYYLYCYFTKSYG